MLHIIWKRGSIWVIDAARLAVSNYWSWLRESAGASFYIILPNFVMFKSFKVNRIIRDQFFLNEDIEAQKVEKYVISVRFYCLKKRTWILKFAFVMDQKYSIGRSSCVVRQPGYLVMRQVDGFEEGRCWRSAYLENRLGVEIALKNVS